MLTPEALEPYLGRAAALDPFWLVTGAEELLMIESADRIRSRARELGYADREVIELKGNASWAPLISAADSVGLFSDRKFLEVRVPGGKPGARGEKTLLDYLGAPHEGVVTLFVFPEADWKTAKTDWWKALLKFSTVVACPAVSRKDLPGWLAARLRTRNRQSAAPEALEYFADLVDGNLLAAAWEVEKLELLFPEGEVTLEMIQKSVSGSARYDLPALIASVSTGDAVRAARVVDALEAQGEGLPPIIAMLSLQLRSAARLQASGRGFVPGVFTTPELTSATKRWTPKRIEAALTTLAGIDRIAKGLPVAGRNDNPWAELKSVVLFLAR